ncbi:unnamed protein product [Gadus morhua 'NCC']
MRYPDTRTRHQHQQQQQQPRWRPLCSALWEACVPGGNRLFPELKLLDESQVCSCSSGIIHRHLGGREQPQVVDEVPLPRRPTGKGNTQLPDAATARCRR